MFYFKECLNAPAKLPNNMDEAQHKYSPTVHNLLFYVTVEGSRTETVFAVSSVSKASRNMAT